MYYSLPASNVIYLIIHCAHPVAIAAPMPKKLMKAAKKGNPPWPAPKRGKARSLIKAFPMKRKMPKVAYVRDQKTVMKVDKRKMRWGRPVHMLASLQGRSLLRLLRSDGLLQTWEGKSCPRCGEGSLGDLYFGKEQVWLHRCRRKGCQVRVRPHYYHPIFFVGSGANNTSLSPQAAILCCAHSGVPVSSVPALLDIHPKPVEKIYANLEVAGFRYVQLMEKKIVFGADKKWSAVEADEADLGKEELIKAGNGNRKVQWEQWGGLVERGRPHTLVLYRLTPKLTAKRAPGPGPITRRDWASIAAKRLSNTR